MFQEKQCVFLITTQVNIFLIFILLVPTQFYLFYVKQKKKHNKWRSSCDDVEGCLCFNRNFVTKLYVQTAQTEIMYSSYQVQVISALPLLMCQKEEIYIYAQPQHPRGKYYEYGKHESLGNETKITKSNGKCCSRSTVTTKYDNLKKKSTMAFTFIQHSYKKKQRENIRNIRKFKNFSKRCFMHLSISHLALYNTIYSALLTNPISMLCNRWKRVKGELLWKGGA